MLEKKPLDGGSLDMNAVLSHKKQLEEFNVMEIERKFCKLKV